MATWRLSTIEVGILELNKNPINYFNEVEQAAFSPTNKVPGIGFSPDKMLQGRLFSYPDTQRYRLGVNYNALPINRPIVDVNNGYRNGSMRFDDNGGDTPNYEPSHFTVPTQTDIIDEPALKIDGNAARYEYETEDNNDFVQAGALYNVMNTEEQDDLIANLAASMVGVPKKILKLQLEHFFKADKTYGEKLAKTLGV